MLAAMVIHSAVDRLVRRPSPSSVTANVTGPAIATASTAQNMPSRRPGRRTATIEIGGRPLLRHSLEAFCIHPAIAGVAVVYQPAHQALYEAATAGLPLLPPIAGGASRQGSVLNGLEGVAGVAPDRVLIHDAARPFVDRGTIDRTLAALETSAGAIAAVPVTDTIKRAHGHAGEPLIAGTVDRRL